MNDIMPFIPLLLVPGLLVVWIVVHELRLMILGYRDFGKVYCKVSKGRPFGTIYIPENMKIVKLNGRSLFCFELRVLYLYPGSYLFEVEVQGFRILSIDYVEAGRTYRPTVWPREWLGDAIDRPMAQFGVGTPTDRLNQNGSELFLEPIELVEGEKYTYSPYTYGGIRSKKYFEYEVPSRSHFFCDDEDCPFETEIGRGKGYLLIEQDLINFRQLYPSLRKARQALEGRIPIEMEKLGLEQCKVVKLIRIGPKLLCDYCAKRRNLDLKVASKDAKEWWEIGSVPLRPTPRKIYVPGKKGLDEQMQKLILRCAPENCLLYVDGEFVGTASANIKLTMDFHKIRLEKSGYEAWERTINVRRFGNTMRIVLKAKTENMNNSVDL